MLWQVRPTLSTLRAVGDNVLLLNQADAEAPFVSFNALSAGRAKIRKLRMGGLADLQNRKHRGKGQGCCNAGQVVLSARGDLQRSKGTPRLFWA